MADAAARVPERYPRLLVDASLDAYDTSEYTLAERLWPHAPEHLPLRAVPSQIQKTLLA